MENMTAERLQQEIDGLTGWKYILIFGRVDQDSKYPDMWKIDHSLNGFYTVSGPDFLTFGEKLQVTKKGSGYFQIKITKGADTGEDIIGYCYLKNVYKIDVNTPEASA